MNKINIEPELLWALYYGNCYSICMIGNIFGCSREPIRDRMIEHNIPRRSLTDAKYKINIEPELLESLYLGNAYSMYQIGNIFGCNEETIRTKLIKYDIARRNNGGYEINDFEFDNRQKQIFEGCMLGDGGLARNVNCSFCNGDNHKEYLIWLQKQLGVKDISSIWHDKRIMRYALRTRTIPSLREEHKRWYPYETRKGTDQNRNNKIIPEDIELTPIKMLFWYIGDGTFSKRDKTAVFTNGLDFDEWSALSKKMCRLLDVNTGISIAKLYKNRESKQKYRLYLNKPVTSKFFDMVDSLGFDIPECYQYKFGR